MFEQDGFISGVEKVSEASASNKCYKIINEFAGCRELFMASLNIIYDNS